MVVLVKLNKKVIMKIILMGITLVLSCAALSAAQTTTAGPKDWLDQWQTATKQLIQVAEAMPADKYDYKPVKEVESFGDQLKHTMHATKVLLANAQGRKMAMPDVSAELGKLKSKEEIIAALRKSAEAGAAVVKDIAGKNDAEVVDSQFFGKTTRRYLLMQAIAHDQNHYGQLVYYLRLNGIVPPASRR